jgi:hypothetical protein
LNFFQQKWIGDQVFSATVIDGSKNGIWVLFSIKISFYDAIWAIIRFAEGYILEDYFSILECSN